MKSEVRRIFKKKKVEGIRQGQESDELLGYRLERGLHENSEVKKVEKESISSKKISSPRRKKRKKKRN